MKLNRLLILLAVFLLLGVAVVLLSWLKDRTRSNTFLGIDRIDNIVRVAIQEGDKKITIEKEGQEWIITEPIRYRADREKVTSLMDKIGNLTLDGIISDKKEKHKNFDLGEGQGIEMKLEMKNGDSLSSIFGKMAADYSHIYLRLADSDEVYLATSIRKYDLKTEASQWEDRSILSFNKADLREVDLIGSDEVVNLVKEEDKWLIKKGEERFDVDKGKWENILNSLEDLKAIEIVHEKTEEDHGFSKPEFEIRLKFDFGKMGIVVGRKKDEYKYYVKNLQDDTVFLISQGTLNRFKKSEKDIRKEIKEEKKKEEKED